MSEIVTKPSAIYSDNFDAIFRNKKVTYAVEFKDGWQDYMKFDSDSHAEKYLKDNILNIVVFEKQEILEG